MASYWLFQRSAFANTSDGFATLATVTGPTAAAFSASTSMMVDTTTGIGAIPPAAVAR